MKVIHLLLALSLTGCATVRTVDTGNESSIRAVLEEGDQITLTMRDNQQYELTVVSLCDVAIDDEDRDGQSVAIPCGEVMLVQVREPRRGRPGRTAAIVAGTIGGLSILYILALGLALLVL